MFYPVKFIIFVHVDEIEAFEAFGENIDQDRNKALSFEPVAKSTLAARAQNEQQTYTKFFIT